MPGLTDHGAPSAAAGRQRRRPRRGAVAPLARRAICPPGPSTNTVGVLDIELLGQVRARGHVDLDVHYAIAAAGHIGKQLPRSAARSAEGRGELQQSSPGAKRLAQVSLGQPPHR
jgi:hypothetical protein